MDTQSKLLTHYFTEYSYLLTLPKDARSISIREVHLTPSYFALRTTSGTYLLNGNWRISWPSQKLMAGTLFTYSRSYNKPEQLTAEGPLTDDVVVEVCILAQQIFDVFIIQNSLLTYLYICYKSE